MHWGRIIICCVALMSGEYCLFGQTLAAGSVGSVDANGNVAFSLTFDRVPDFLSVDAINRPAFAFQFYIGAVTAPPTLTTRPLLSLVRTEISGTGEIVVRNDSPPATDANAGGWGSARGRVSYKQDGRTVTFSVPASVLNVTGPFVYTLEIFSYGSLTSSYTGASGGPVLFTAPASIAHTVFRDTASFLRFASIGRGYNPVKTESTIVFDDDVRFTYLIYREGESPPDTDGRTRILPPKPDGNYRFTRTSNNRAQVEMNFDDGTSAMLELVFNTPTSGTGADLVVNRSFSLSDLRLAGASAARNVSMRGTVGPGRPVVVGFIVPGVREVLIRAVGPSLRPFGIATGWHDPDFQLYQDGLPHNTAQRHNPDWDAAQSGANATDSGTGLLKVFSYLGAFPLQPGAKDAADILRLAPGAYTVVCAPAQEDTDGDLLVEVYFLP